MYFQNSSSRFSSFSWDLISLNSREPPIRNEVISPIFMFFWVFSVDLKSIVIPFWVFWISMLIFCPISAFLVGVADICIWVFSFVRYWVFVVKFFWWRNFSICCVRVCMSDFCVCHS